MKYIESRLLASVIFILSILLPSVAWAESEYQLTVVANPTMAGTFNKSSATLYAGVTIQLVAYSNSNFTFIQWTDESGAVISKQMKLDFVMPDHDCQLTAEYEYNPANPANPVQNYWNKLLGEVVVDDFTTGSLQNAVKNVIGDSKAADVMMITVAGIMNANDFGIINTYSACTLLDFSRVTGVTQVPSYAFDNTKLEAVYLPATIESIGTQAFYGCRQLSSMIIYAKTPPSLGSNVFTNVPEGLVVYVPATAIAQYQNAAGWKDFNILPIQEDIRSISVSLPNGTNIQDYAQMWLELTNTKNGQRIHYVMTDRTQYTFPNIIRNTSWNVVLRNERGDVFGQIENVEVKDEDVTVTFASLSKPQNVSLSVLTPDGKNVTEQVRVTWTDVSGNYLAQSASLSGLPVGYQANYRVVLSQELAMMYNTPQVVEYTLKDGGNNLTYQLETIKQVQLTGKVKDETTGLPLSGAVISASQTFGGKYSKTQNTKTDKDGVFTITVFDVPTSLAFAASDYVSQTIVCDSLMNGDATITLPNVSLKYITGATITIGFTYTSDDGETQNWYSDYQNVSYTLYNTTREKPISQFNVQYPQIVLLEEVNDGDVLKLTASSRTNAFKAVETTTIIAEQKAEATFTIIELGKIQASFEKNGNASVVGSLYDASGKLVKTYNYTNALLTISNLADGKYTLVTMGSSRLFNTIYDLAQLPQTGLTEGTDYAQNTVEVKSGTISQIIIEGVPTLDESKLYYTGDNTSFTVNKPSIVAGNYLTLTGHIDFKPAYATSVSNVQMIVDLPESCQFVENSVMVSNSTSNYVLNGHQIIIPMTRYSDRVRFCIIPTLGGEYAPSAFVQFDLEGETVTQPIGSANYTSKDLSISVPSTVAKTAVPVSGTAIGTSSIDIYDNGVLIGQTTSLANGTWATTCELNEPFNLSVHNIYARVITKDGVDLQSEIKNCLYDKDAIEVKTVTIVNTAHRSSLQPTEFVTVFDFENKTTSTKSYNYWPAYPDFTFIVDLTDNDTTVVSDVMLHVFTDNNEVVHINTNYNSSQDRWVATRKFYQNSLPVNVSVSFNDISKTDIDTLEANKTWNDFVKSLEKRDSLEIITEELEQSLNSGDVDNEKVDSILNVIFVINVNRLRDKGQNPPGVYKDPSQSPSPSENPIFSNTPIPSKVAETIAASETNDVQMYENMSNFHFPSTEEIYSYLSKFLPKEDDLQTTITPNLPNGAYFPDMSVNISSLGSDLFVNMTENIAVFFKAIQNWHFDEDYALQDRGMRMVNEKGDYITFNYDNTSLERLNSNVIDEIINEASAVIGLGSLAVWFGELGNGIRGVQLVNAFRAGQIEPKLALELLKKNANTAKSLRGWSNYLGTLSFGLGGYFQYQDINKVVKANNSWDDIIYKIDALCEKQEAEWIKEFAETYKKRMDLYTRCKSFGTSCTNLITAGTIALAPESIGFSFLGTAASIYASKRLDIWEKEFTKSDKINKSEIFKMVNTNLKCKPFPIDEFPEAYFDPITGIYDPSGYVYEGVLSNRIEGVTATAYYKEMVEDMYGDLHENIVKWDASEYAQENPLFTDENGMYAWDVPQGLWQVKFEKDGYETTYSEWLPVPPPQLDVNIAMTQNVQPNVIHACAFEDAVEVEFDKYMIPELLTTENVIVMQGDKPVKGTIELLNEEASYENNDETFASKVRFNAAHPFTAQEVTLMVSNRVKSYAGIRMQDDFSQTFKVEQEIKQILCDSLTVVDYGGKSTLTVSVLPASASKGKTMTVKTSSPMILGVATEQVIIGEDGTAEISVSGELPGTAALTFSVEGTDKTALTIASVEQKVYTFVATPIANIASGSVVDTGTQIILSCETDGVTIYYTIDGSCPCDNASRIKYDGTPIIINEGVTIKVIAVAPNGIESEVAEFVYTTKDEEDTVIEVPVTTTNTKDEYDISGRKVGRKTKGIIIRNNNGTNRKVLVK